MLTQQNRIGRLTTPLGPDVLCLVELHAREALSELFDFELIAASENADIDFDALIGQPCSVHVDADGAGARWFHGVLTEGEWNEQANDLTYYRLRLQPWCWLLTKTADCRIHHDKTVVQIIQATFADHGLSDYKWLLTHDYPVLHYTVQYAETDWNFVCRLMEQHGIYYFFNHNEGSHILALADSYGAHAAQGPAIALEFNSSHADALAAMRTPYVSRWSPRRKLRSGRFEITDYNHLTPGANQLANRPNPHAYANGQFEVFDWPGPHVDLDQGESYVRFRAEAEETQDRRRLADGVAASLFPGVRAALTRHPREAENGEYIVAKMQSRLGPQVYRTDGATQGDGGFEGSYEFQPSSLQYRAPFLTHKPRIPSLQTATVVGAVGGSPSEEIDCDDHGRILVHFFWDRHCDQSCRIRVNQVWGGQNWGAQVIPRIGMEVMVAYIDGDPDRPIVVGSVPNPQKLPVPYELPAQKTRMVWRSNSYKSSGRNEFTMEDFTANENFFTHAQKDATHRALNNSTRRVDQNDVTSVGANQAVNVGGNQKTEVGGSMNLVIGGTGAGAMALMGPLMGLSNDTAGMLSQTGGGPLAGLVASATLGFFSGAGLSGLGGVTNGADPTQDAGNALRQAGAQVGKDVGSILSGLPGTMNTIVGSFKTDSVGVARSETIGVAKVTNVGQNFNTQVGKKYKIVVGDEFEIIVGKSRFVMDKEGNVTILGVNFTFAASGPVKVNGEVIDLN